jgi:hypothetical protein
VNIIITGLSKCGHTNSSVLFFRKIFGLEIPPHLSIVTTKDRVHKVILETTYKANLPYADNIVILSVLKACAAGHFGYDALSIITYAEDRNQDSALLDSYTISQGIQFWELVVQSLATPKNITLIPRVLEIMSCMERPVSATKRMFTMCLSSCAVVNNTAIASTVVKAMLQSGLSFDDEWLVRCVDQTASYLKSNISSTEVITSEKQMAMDFIKSALHSSGLVLSDD